MRYPSIDILRGIAILLMIQVHFVDNLSSREESSAWLYMICSWLGMLPAPLFALLSGLSFHLWMRKQQASGAGDEVITKVAVRRGLFLFGIGLVFNFFVWLPEETFNWDILTLLGSSMILLAYARKLPGEVLALICIMIVLVTPPLRVMGEYSAYWEEEAFVYDMELQEVVLGYVVNGYFPLLPWLVFPIAGFLLGSALLSSSPRSTVNLSMLGAGLVLLAAAGVSFGDAIPSFLAKHYATGLTLYPASTPFVLGTLGLSLLSVILLHYAIDHPDRAASPGPLFRYWQRWSAYSLTIYIVHHLVHIWPLWLYGVVMGHDDPTYYWRIAMSTPLAFGLAVTFVLVCGFALMWLDRYKQWTFESAMRWLCDE